MVQHFIVELYDSTKREIFSFIAENGLEGVPSVTISADFWTCSPQGKNYLGVRLYFVDKNWEFRSVMLGAQEFAPSYNERNDSIRRPIRNWLQAMIGSFGLRFADIYGTVSDASSDTKYMLKEGLHLNWEWCIPHLSKAATKLACGIVNNKTQSRNPEMTDLIVRMSSTIQKVKKVEKMGSLFSACELQGEVKSDKLLDYKSRVLRMCSQDFTIVGSIDRVVC